MQCLTRHIWSQSKLTYKLTCFSNGAPVGNVPLLNSMVLRAILRVHVSILCIEKIDAFQSTFLQKSVCVIVLPRHRLLVGRAKTTRYPSTIVVCLSLD